MHAKPILLGGLIAVAAAPALAQGNNAFNIVGTVDNIDASSISLKTDQGGQEETPEFMAPFGGGRPASVLMSFSSPWY